MMPWPLLWADTDWVKLVVPIVMFSVYMLNRLLGGESPAAKQAKARQQARAKPPQPPAEKQRLEDEVGEFLRRATQRNEKERKESRPQDPIAPVKAKQPRRPLAGAPVARPTSKPSEVPPPPQPNRPRSLAAETERRSNLGDDRVEAREVTQAEAALQTHVEQAFSHQVGTLGAAMTDTAPSSSAISLPPTTLVDLLRDPQSIRDAIIVSEILRRPDERW